jgi:hypothetical protein
MFSLTNLITSLALLTPLATAVSQFKCGFDVMSLPTGELEALRSAILANQFPPQRVAAANLIASDLDSPSFSQQVRLGSILLCIRNPFVFASTTVFPDEMAELVTLYLECQRSVAAGNDVVLSFSEGLLDGDTGLDVPGTIQPITFACS